MNCVLLGLLICVHRNPLVTQQAPQVPTRVWTGFIFIFICVMLIFSHNLRNPPAHCSQNALVMTPLLSPVGVALNVFSPLFSTVLICNPATKIIKHNLWGWFTVQIVDEILEEAFRQMYDYVNVSLGHKSFLHLQKTACSSDEKRWFSAPYSLTFSLHIQLLHLHLLTLTCLHLGFQFVLILMFMFSVDIKMCRFAVPSSFFASKHNLHVLRLATLDSSQFWCNLYYLVKCWCSL